jgi:hypothetical protein
MEQKRKSILGLSFVKNIIQKHRIYFSKPDKYALIQTYLASDCSKQEIWEKYIWAKFYFQRNFKIL